MADKHTYQYYANLSPISQKPSVWCGEINGENVYRLSTHRFMFVAKLHAIWKNWRR